MWKNKDESEDVPMTTEYPSRSQTSSPGAVALGRDLAQLYNHGASADVIFIIGRQEVEFKAHRVILWARCQHFRKLCSDPDTENGPDTPLRLVYRHYDPDTFEQMLQYIYTGEVTIKDASVFSVIVMAKEFGLPELLVLGENYVVTNLTVNNACLFMGAALQLEKLQYDMELTVDLTETCVRFMEENARGCVMSEMWPTLTKAAVIKLVSSPQFSLEEDMIWGAVISWAKVKAGVDQEKAPKLWTDKEKQIMAETLDGILQHIQWSLVSSRLFAEEVEPSGLVSMGIILERYRQAAIANFEKENDVPPQTRQQYFIDSAILQPEHLHYQRLLNMWYGSEQKWRLIYRASRDGFEAETFHDHCDGLYPTFTIVKGSKGNICGGFSDVPWTNKAPPIGKYLPSHRAFLFTLLNFQDVPPTKYDVKNSTVATLHHPRYGPMFGAGADLCLASNCNVTMDSYSNFPHSYEGEFSDRSVLMGDYNFKVADYELFTLQP